MTSEPAGVPAGLAALDLQPWAGHGSLRRRELRRILEHVEGDLGLTLEIGCGNGLSAALLGERASRVIASDLPFVDPTSHAIGLATTRSFLRQAGSDAVLAGCSGEALPLRDQTIDTVFMLYSLEHVPDRERCLAEVRRVLRPGGRLVNVVPTAPASIVYPVAFYAELLRRIAGRLVRALRRRPDPLGGARSDSVGGIGFEPIVHDWASFRAAYPHFPLPSPHGEFDSYATELREQRVGRWEQVVASSGLVVEGTLAMSLVPVQLLLALAGSFGERVHAALEPLDRRLLRGPGARRFAQSVCIVATRPA
jgi:SAM-dependent methyltransferase